jgi:hypothetical protein
MLPFFNKTLLFIKKYNMDQVHNQPEMGHSPLNSALTFASSIFSAEDILSGLEYCIKHISKILIHVTLSL